MMIHNVEELARSLDTSVPELKEHIKTYTDYPTKISFDMVSVKLRTSVPYIDESNEKTLSFPFTEDDFYDAVSGLQCWADTAWWEKEKEES